MTATQLAEYIQAMITQGQLSPDARISLQNGQTVSDAKPQSKYTIKLFV